METTSSPSHARVAFAFAAHMCTGRAHPQSQNIGSQTCAVARRAILAQGVALVAATLAARGVRAEAALSEPTASDEEVTQFVRTSSGLEYRDYRVGKGVEVALGDTIVVQWTGRLADRYGWPFQKETADPVTLRLTDENDIIAGFREGVLGMREGGKRRLVIPKELGYEREGQAPLPADYGDRRRLYSTVLNKRRFASAGALVIDVELKRCRKPR